MATQYQDFVCSRGGPFKPPTLDISLPVADFSAIRCTVRKLFPSGQPDETDAGMVGEVTLVGGASGAIVASDVSAIDITIKHAVVALWTDGEYAYSVVGTYIGDGEPYDFVRGRILMTWSANPAP